MDRLWDALKLTLRYAVIYGAIAGLEVLLNRLGDLELPAFVAPIVSALLLSVLSWLRSIRDNPGVVLRVLGHR